MKWVMANRRSLLATPAYGLDLRDTMQSWKQAPIEVRAQLLKNVLSERGEVGVTSCAAVMACMNSSCRHAAAVAEARRRHDRVLHQGRR